MKQPLILYVLEEWSSPWPLRYSLRTPARWRPRSQLVRLGYMLMSIVIARFDVTLNAFLTLLGMLWIALLGVDAARRRYLLNARTSADTDANAARRRARCRCRRRCRLVALFVPQTAQKALVNRLWRGLWLLAARWTGRRDYHLREQNDPTVKVRPLVG